MKFTKEDAVKELSAKYKPRYGDPAKWERTIQECVEHALAFIGEDSETELDDFIGKVTPFLETTAGFLLKETSSVASEKQRQLDDLKKQLESKGNGKTETDEELLKRLEKLERESEETRRLEAISRKRTEIKDFAKKKGVKNDKDLSLIDFMLDNATLDAETDAEQTAAKYVEAVNKWNADRGGDDTPTRAKGEPVDNSVKAVIEKAAQMAKDRIA